MKNFLTSNNESTSVDCKNKETSKPNSNVDLKKKEMPKRDWFRWVFGGLFLFGTSTGLYYLFKNKNRFLNK